MASETLAGFEVASDHCKHNDAWQIGKNEQESQRKKDGERESSGEVPNAVKLSRPRDAVYSAPERLSNNLPLPMITIALSLSA